MRKVLCSMKVPALLLVLAVSPLAFAAEPEARPADPAPQNVRSAKRRSEVIPPVRATARMHALPPRPPASEGVTDISFDDFFKMPVGPLGLEFTEKFRALKGQRVRIAGFQVVEMVGVCNAEPNAGSVAVKARAMLEASVPGRLLLCATPESVNFSHYGLCEDLPPQVVFITVPELFGQPVPQHPGPLLVTGILDVGNKQEPDGRVSSVRLLLDPAPAIPTVSVQPTPAAPLQPTTTASNTTK